SSGGIRCASVLARVLAREVESREGGARLRCPRPLARAPRIPAQAGQPTQEPRDDVARVVHVERDPGDADEQAQADREGGEPDLEPTGLLAPPEANRE